MKVEAAVLGSPSLILIVLMVSVDVKQHYTSKQRRARELCESRGGRPGLSVPNSNSPYGLCGRKATSEEEKKRKKEKKKRKEKKNERQPFLGFVLHSFTSRQIYTCL